MKALNGKIENRNLQEKINILAPCYIPNSDRRDISTDAITLHAASAITHVRGGVMGSNVEYVENCKRP